MEIVEIKETKLRWMVNIEISWIKPISIWNHKISLCYSVSGLLPVTNQDQTNWRVQFLKPIAERTLHEAFALIERQQRPGNSNKIPPWQPTTILQENPYLGYDYRPCLYPKYQRLLSFFINVLRAEFIILSQPGEANIGLIFLFC